MQVQVNTDRNIAGHEALDVQVSGVVESTLIRISDHIQRVEVHLSDQNSDRKGGNDDISMPLVDAGRQQLSAAP